MIPHHAQYAIVLLLGTATGVLIFYKELPTVIRSPKFYPPLLIFVLASWLFDKIGIAQGWWVFSWDYMLGPHLMGVPLEEIFLFLCAFTMTAAAWKFFLLDDGND